MSLHLLIDASVWLDLTKDHRHLPFLLDTLFEMAEAKEVGGSSCPVKSCLRQRSSAYGVSCGQAVRIR